ncbi:Asp-tRNA(Asn)/Glu-tRNA(Gln) amidotransferase GatCAB subunit A [Candidatus Aerophobetes bacterium]|uniref:Glutamyl-tRNA(Gln) amidotransferase subunit A n=1 Tax=Aerophobetes bacterium TaxID=2030807 RepID=A0A2A4X0V2_UNCAE|nr:MAG: Asp-tRNA(Asn)/Glu-tRNA(Gln) amidotransferase GatCAB subunit A [Candidatus Aerophobetes bacterium]
MFKCSAVELNKQLIEGKISACEIVEYYIQRAQIFDEDIKAFISVCFEKALEKAYDIDQRLARGEHVGKLAGIPIAIKDNINIAGMATSCASKYLKNYIAPYSATVVELLEKEDAIIIGKTNLDEFAMGSSCETSYFGYTRNPWNLSTSPGGSSGGSAAAVAARLAPLSLGTDTGGSVRQPAAFTGTVGFKPTYGRVSRHGLVAFASSLDQIGPFATCVEDAALIMGVIGRPCVHDSTCSTRLAENYLEGLDQSILGKTIGIPSSFLNHLSKEHQNYFDVAIKRLEDLGVKIKQVDLSHSEYAIQAYYIISTAEASTNLARFDGIRYGYRSPHAKNLSEVYNLSRTEGLGLEVKMRLLTGAFVLSAGHSSEYYHKAQKIRRLIIDDFKRAFKECDVVAMPTTGSSAFEIGSIQDPVEMYLQDLYTTSANLAGLPAVSVPSGFDENNMPLGLQFIGPRFADKRVLHFARQLEKSISSKQSLPPLFDKEAS